MLKTIGLAALSALVLAAPLATSNAEAKSRHYGYQDARHGSTYTPGIDRRIRRQTRRIRRGRATHKLTRAEYFRLKYALFRIKNATRLAKSDGRVSRGERRRLHSRLDRNSRLIARLSHNGRYAGYGQKRRKSVH